eukprot:2344259-Prymnesium_polylepis.1
MHCNTIRARSGTGHSPRSSPCFRHMRRQTATLQLGIAGPATNTRGYNTWVVLPTHHNTPGRAAGHARRDSVGHAVGVCVLRADGTRHADGAR